MSIHQCERSGGRVSPSALRLGRTRRRTGRPETAAEGDGTGDDERHDRVATEENLSPVQTFFRSQTVEAAQPVLGT